jgi:tRNA threonylcarbamoyladenosine biosynthesis protein TsaE
MIDWLERTASIAQTHELAARLAEQLENGSVVLLYGELGAGKTEFVRGFVAAFDAATRVSSPTFTLVNSYPTKPPIHHLDLYRISSAGDLADLGLDEYINGDGIALIEWAEKCEAISFGNSIGVTIRIVSTTEREFRIKAFTNADIGN